MRIELTWPRSGTEDRTLTLALPDLPATGLLRPALRYTSRLCTPAALRRAVTCAEPFIGAAARHAARTQSPGPPCRTPSGSPGKHSTAAHPAPSRAGQREPSPLNRTRRLPHRLRSERRTGNSAPCARARSSTHPGPTWSLFAQLQVTTVAKPSDGRGQPAFVVSTVSATGTLPSAPD